MAKHFGVTAKDIGYFSFTELEKALKINKLDKQLISQRKSKTFLILIDKPKLDIKILTNSFPASYNNVIKQDQKQLSNREVRGTIGQPGLVTGRVKIIKGVRDLHKIKAGDILIANTTHPDYLPAMKLASAFITDEGGIASHAAIVARELRLPCIVGAKIATKVFKDGDIVEVDANKGTVKKI